MNKGKKFDICLMNPPYAKSLHLLFLEKAILICDNVVSVLPIRWLLDPIGKYKKSSDYNKYNSTIIKYINDLSPITSAEAHKLFNAIITMDCGIYKCNKLGGWKNIYENSILNKVIEKTKGIPIVKVNDITKKCFCLLTLIDGGHRERKNSKGSEYNIIRNEQWYGKYYVNGISTNGNTILLNKQRNKMATNGNIETWPAVEFNTEIEALNFYKFTKTKFFKYIYKEEMVDVHVHPKYLPFMNDYSKEWTDEMIYNYFGITKSEQNEIDRTIT